jgi:hypothetical protein
MLSLAGVALVTWVDGKRDSIAASARSRVQPVADRLLVDEGPAGFARLSLVADHAFRASPVVGQHLHAVGILRSLALFRKYSGALRPQRALPEFESVTYHRKESLDSVPPQPTPEPATASELHVLAKSVPVARVNGII